MCKVFHAIPNFIFRITYMFIRHWRIPLCVAILLQSNLYVYPLVTLMCNKHQESHEVPQPLMHYQKRIERCNK